MPLRVGVIGGGQLARMMIAPAVELGVELRVLAEDDGDGGIPRRIGRRATIATPTPSSPSRATST